MSNGDTPIIKAVASPEAWRFIPRIYPSDASLTFLIHRCLKLDLYLSVGVTNTMDLKRYTNKAQEALVGAQTLTTEFGHSQLEPLHLLTALMQQDEGVVPEVVAKIGGRPANLRQELEQMIQGRPHVSGS